MVREDDRGVIELGSVEGGKRLVPLVGEINRAVWDSRIRFGLRNIVEQTIRFSVSRGTSREPGCYFQPAFSNFVRFLPLLVREIPNGTSLSGLVYANEVKTGEERRNGPRELSRCCWRMVMLLFWKRL